MIRRPTRSTLSSSSAASDVYKRQLLDGFHGDVQPGRDLFVGESLLEQGAYFALALGERAGRRGEAQLFEQVSEDQDLAACSGKHSASQRRGVDVTGDQAPYAVACPRPHVSLGRRIVDEPD